MNAPRTLLAGVLAVAAHGAACASSPPKPLDPALADVVFEGAADGPALDALLAATPRTDATKGATFDSPADGSELPIAKLPTFTWHLPAGATAARAVGRPPRLLPAAAEPLHAAPAWLRELLGPEREAHAGDLAMSGTGYLLLFSSSEHPRLLRVFTTSASYTPDAKAWKTLGTALMWTTVSIFSASFADDALAPGGGPFEGTPIQFCIER